ncbi:hypothetical protein BXZ70DRAFT_137015 [Cristinia sonorae]|uniref:Uncharacterized protein n=1 Tax=Cristinia sonorae TaxID=1940300 RepID=A0A8K0UPY5_9AGAR|nr:hypothetical protein BXZ70DRAFT_137015 [Cristinia sonorae]
MSVIFRRWLIKTVRSLRYELSRSPSQLDLNAEAVTIMPRSAFLVDYSEPGDGIPQDLFDDWYNNEHIPARVANPLFSRWVRLEAIDGKEPKLGAAYDVTLPDDTPVSALTSLWEAQSDREKKILGESKLFDRRIYEILNEARIPPPSPSFDINAAAPIIVIRTLDIKDDAPEDMESQFFEWWLAEDVPFLSSIPGWTRSRLFVLKESEYSGVDAGKQKKQAKYLGVHEWSNPDFEKHPQFLALEASPRRAEIVKNLIFGERRVLKVSKQWTRED